MVWSTTAVDKITVPASVPIGGAQDGVIISGADIPTELKAISITAVIIYQRGDYPSFGANPEVKYYFMGLTKLANPTYRALTIGSVFDMKNGTLVAKQHIDFPAEVYSYNAGEQQILKAATISYMDVQFGRGNHQTRSAITSTFTPAKAGQTLTANGWYNILLNAGWSFPVGNQFLWGVEFKPTATGAIHLRGGVVCGVAASAGSIICNLGVNDYFKTFPDRAIPFVGIWDTPGSGTCQLVLYPNGDLTIGGQLSPPPNGSNVVFATTYYGQQ